MVRNPPRARGDVATARPQSAGGAPLIVTAVLPGEVQSFADKLRRQHYPPDRNQVAAHVTLFHSLPPSSEAEVRVLLKSCTQNQPPLQAQVCGILRFSGGTALEIKSPQLQSLREEIAEHLHGLLSAQDSGVPKLHITIQNKVTSREARSLQIELESEFRPRNFVVVGLALHAWRGGPWDLLKTWSFRG
ncbi:MAG: 2'-5' RNA ligase family protein [Porphyrobacter sp.]|nr:2'-5' RNA ligase family protein [Porphyrobacter sp.]